MPAKYVHLSGRGIDMKYDSLHGIKEEEESEKSELSPVDCPRCGAKNDPEASFCQNWGQALTREAFEEIETKEEKAGAVLSELGISEYWREEHKLTEKQYREAKEEISEEVSDEMNELGGLPSETVIWEVIRYLGKDGTGQRDEIAGAAERSGKTISRKAKALKGLRLLRSSQEGYNFTAKGVRFFKKLNEEGGLRR